METLKFSKKKSQLHKNQLFKKNLFCEKNF